VIALALAVYLAVVLGMEAVAWAAHRYVMHGPLWVLHESHHRPRSGWLQANDLFAVFFAVPSVALIYVGSKGHLIPLAAGLGMATYGVLYFLVHDVVVHRRLPWPFALGRGYLRSVARAHLVHHRTHTRDGARNFGFVLPPRSAER
jgi:beta-carotene 3-hydroxylase